MRQKQQGGGSNDALQAWLMAALARVCQTNGSSATPEAPTNATPLSAPSCQRSFVSYFRVSLLHAPDDALRLKTTHSPPTMAAAALDVGYIAASYAVPDTTIRSLLSEPTVELVQSLLAQIEAKAREHDDLKSEKIKVDVELEAAVQGGETRARALKAAADKAQKETEQLQLKLAREGALDSWVL